MPHLMEAYASQMLNQASDWTGDAELMEVARGYLEGVNDSRLRVVLDSYGLHLDCHLSRRSRSMSCLTFAIYTRSTPCITWLHTCHTRCGYQWRACTVVWDNGIGSDEVHNQASNGIYAFFCQGEAWEEKCS